jgi:hypothetical protein
MKYGILYIGLLVCHGCNTHRAVDVVRTGEETVVAQGESRVFADSGRTESDSSLSASEAVTAETVKTADYDTLGRLVRTQEIHRVAGKRNVVVATREASVSDSVVWMGAGSLSTEKLTGSKETERTDTDSRPIQGVEWLWVSLAFAVIAAISYLISRKIK